MTVVPLAVPDRPTGWPPLLESWGVALAASGRSAGTIGLRRHHLDRFARVTGLAPAAVTLDDLTGYLAQLPALETRKSVRASLRGFHGWAHATGRLPANPAGRLPGVRVPPGVPRPAPEPVIRDAILATRRRTTPRFATAGDRHRLWVLLAALGGLRRAEIAAVHTDDLLGDLEALRIVGKGGRGRVVPLHPVLAEHLRGHLEQHDRPGWLFPGDHPSGHVAPDTVGKALTRLLGQGWTAHTLRHRFASKAYAGTYDMRAVQELLGHASPATTARYVAVPSAALSAAVAAVPAVPGT